MITSLAESLLKERRLQQSGMSSSCLDYDSLYPRDSSRPLAITPKGRDMILSVANSLEQTSSLFHHPGAYASFHDPNRWRRETFGFMGAR